MVMKLTMKLLFAAVMLGVAFLQIPASAAAPIRVFVNDNELAFPDSQPFSDSIGSTLAPVRVIAGAMGCDLAWDGVSGTVTLTRGRLVAELTAGNSELSVLGVKKATNAAAIILDGQMFVPVRFVAEAFGAVVVWDKDAKTVRIYDEGNDIYRLGGFVWDIEETDVLENNSDGFLTITKQSGLVLDEREVGEDRRAVIAIVISMDPGNDICAQRDEAGALLRQRISAGLVDEILGYADAKEDSSMVIERKYFKDGEYRIIVTGYIGPAVIYVYAGPH